MLQTATLQKQERSRQIIGAQFLRVPVDSEEVKQVAPPARDVILEVDQRAEDTTFANQLALVLLSHINALVDGLPGWCTACEAIDVQSTVDTDVKVPVKYT